MKYIAFCFLMAFTFSVIGQQNEGVIVYKQTTNVHKMMGDRAAQFKDMIPEFRSTNMELKFKGTETLYQMAKKQEVVENDGGGRGRGFRMRMMGGAGGASSMTYRDLEANTSVESSEFMGKKFLIRGEFGEQAWKMSGETKMINDMMCMKATTIDSVESRTMFGGRGGPGGSSDERDKDEEDKKERPNTKEARKITAWFTPTIPVQAGPDNFGNLPGLIVELDIDDGNTIYSIESLEIKTLEEPIVEPSKGKEVTREEYRKIVREKMKEMREQGGGNGFRTIRG